MATLTESIFTPCKLFILNNATGEQTEFKNVLRYEADSLASEISEPTFDGGSISITATVHIPRKTRVKLKQWCGLAKAPKLTYRYGKNRNHTKRRDNKSR